MKIESSIKQGQYTKEDDVEIEIVQTIPQPDLQKVKVFSVKRIKQDIDAYARQIASATEEMSKLQKILDDNAVALKAYKK